VFDGILEESIVILDTVETVSDLNVLSISLSEVISKSMVNLI
jgi:hypothetical protein